MFEKTPAVYSSVLNDVLSVAVHLPKTKITLFLKPQSLQTIIAVKFPLAIASARKEKFALICEELMVSPLEKLLGTWA